MNDAERPYDVVVYGATGYVGALVAAYLAEHAPAEVRIALAGRSAAKLEKVRADLPERARSWPLLQADSTDPASLTAMATATRVLVTTVGPYARYGLPVVEACARAGTDYVDLTGEVLFVRDVIDRFDAVARSTGARIVHSCGYDSIPSDLGVLLLHEQAAADGAGELTAVGLVATVRGGFSGGTIDSMRAQVEAVGADPALRRVVADRHALSPDRAAEPTPSQPVDAPPPARRGSRGMWTAPFVMASYNTRIVRRSNALQDWSYGRSMRYQEVMGTGRGPVGALAAAGTTAGLGLVLACMSFGPTRSLLDRVLPAPGTGPTPEERERGWFRMDLDAATTSGRHYRGVVSGPGDPGYAATAVMLGESALCLALDGARLPDRTGSLTPASAMGTALIDRLRAAGHTYTAGAA
ncbi:trans-acting enoyl reductase family protein [Pseudonocardia sp.]|jgi:short subunit dehydrogenase-like uncharacterized protein|uniref:saccharopine dehydrogenase family protein n=1 Tax=Pseudonocardia sp. TaxID=60912 RepID=UPI00260AE3A9|nr:saccharopine dehydrogenase NADP-binding domain-containing protein [Pseudonocardia sp.]MCW2721795.1 Trans-acting enoyl reductase [Pseudonocardia sp.]